MRVGIGKPGGLLVDLSQPGDGTWPDGDGVLHPEILVEDINRELARLEGTSETGRDWEMEYLRSRLALQEVEK